jgi:hypothetical protein
MITKAIASKGSVLPSPSSLSAPGIKPKASGKKKSKQPVQKKKTKKNERSKKNRGGKLRNGSESSKKKVKTG